MSDQGQFKLIGEAQVDFSSRGTCKNCQHHAAVNVHQSGPPKIVHRCRIGKAGVGGRSRTTRLKHSCGCWSMAVIA